MRLEPAQLQLGLVGQPAVYSYWSAPQVETTLKGAHQRVKSEGGGHNGKVKGFTVFVCTIEHFMQSAIEWRKLTCLLRLRSDKSLALRHCIHLGPRFSPFGGVRLPASRPPPVQGEGQEEGREEGREKEETLAEGGERVGEQR